jgi:hypothetical protein
VLCTPPQADDKLRLPSVSCPLVLRTVSGALCFVLKVPFGGLLPRMSLKVLIILVFGSTLFLLGWILSAAFNGVLFAHRPYFFVGCPNERRCYIFVLILGGWSKTSLVRWSGTASQAFCQKRRAGAT